MEFSVSDASMLPLDDESEVEVVYTTPEDKHMDDASQASPAGDVSIDSGMKENDSEGGGQWITPKSKLLRDREEVRRKFSESIMAYQYNGVKGEGSVPPLQKRKPGSQDEIILAELEERRRKIRYLEDKMEEAERKEQQNVEDQRRLQQQFPRLDEAEGSELLRIHGISHSAPPRRGGGAPPRPTTSQPNPSPSQLIIPSSALLPTSSQTEPDMLELTSETRNLGETGARARGCAFAKAEPEPLKKAPTIQRQGEEGVSSEERAVLSLEQRRALEEAEAGRNLFITGSAGVGKSHLVDIIVRALTAQGKVVRTTASTGIAAVNIGGTTLHSFSHVGLATEPMLSLGPMVARSKKAKQVWRSTDVLVIDEVSMISDELFDKVEYVGRCCRGWPDRGQCILHPQAFGGIQVIAVGDFFQLPPVEKSIRTVGFCFQGTGWASCRFLTVELVKVFRQSDQHFIHLLQMLRRGLVSDEAVQMLRRCTRPMPVEDGILPTMLYPHRNSVAAENARHFDALGGNVAIYTADDTGPSNLLPILDRDVQAPKCMPLKLKTQVMLLVNMDFETGLVNGSRGVVVGFQTVHEWKQRGFKEDRGAASRFEPCRHWLERHDLLPIVLFASGVTRTIPPAKWETTDSSGKERARRVQIPLIHAWALTIHKCQGMTLDRVRMSLTQVFAEGMAYVALSRCRSMEGIQIDDFDPMRIRAHPLVLTFYQMLRNLEEVPSVTNKLGQGPNVSCPSSWMAPVSACVHEAMAASARFALEKARTQEDAEQTREILLSIATKAVDSVLQRWKPPSSQ